LYPFAEAGTITGMMIIGHGIDIVEVNFFQRFGLDLPATALARYFTAGELAHAGTGPHRAEHLAGRFAAKEAVLKALGTGWIDGIAWTDIEIVALPSGAPEVVLHGLCSELAAGQGITSWLLSISHTVVTAVASALAVASPTDRHGH
jgi:holo-[acyl-carrier protein] synthase